MSKTRGQIAYEADILALPNYHDGMPRPTWNRLPDYAKWSWERHPKPRGVKETPDVEA